MIGERDGGETREGGPLDDGAWAQGAVRGGGMEVEIDVRGRAQRVYPVSGAVQEGCDRANNSTSWRSLSSCKDISRFRAPRGEYRTTRCSRFGLLPRLKMRPNSSRTYWVTRPLGATSHFSPSTSITRLGMGKCICNESWTILRAPVAGLRATDPTNLARRRQYPEGD